MGRIRATTKKSRAASIGMTAFKYSLPACGKTSNDGANPSANPVA